MSKITPDILKALAPHTPPNLRDRFIPFLNDALPRYGITSELEVAAFLATACFESQYFQKTKEGHARAGTKARRYHDKYWATGFYGRGIFQTTHEPNYRAFGRKMKAAGRVDDAELFVKHPELLEQPEWAVESACVYWQDNHLGPWARKGLKGFFGLQGLVNRGDANKEALDYPDRLAIYEAARRVLPDDFNLGTESAAATTGSAGQDVEKPAAGEPSLDDLPAGDVAGSQEQEEPPSTLATVVVEKEDPQGFFSKIWKKLTGWLTGLGGLSALQGYKQQIDDLGLPGFVLKYALIAGAVAFLLWLIFEAVHHLWSIIAARWLTVALVKANSTPGTVETACAADLPKFAAQGATVINRG
jgi:putative chitinase